MEDEAKLTGRVQTSYRLEVQKISMEENQSD